MGASVDYFEIGSPDPARSQAFYGPLFGWDMPDPSGPAGYAMVDGAAGGLWDTSGFGGASWAIFYVQVDDVHASVDRAQELGASIVVPVTDAGNTVFAHLVDPLGNRFGVYTPKS